MIDGLKPYPKMRDSGVLWLGEVPGHWNVQRIKTLFREKDERSGDGNRLILWLTRARGLLPQAEASSRLASAADLSKYKVCRPGELVMNRIQAWSGIFAVSEYEGLVSPDYSVFATTERLEPRFFEQVFKTPVVVEQFLQASKGIGSGFNRLYTPDFGAIPVAFPPLPAQTAIVRFLDHADRRIRRYIRAKPKLIKLLEELKAAIMHCAVTRGLDPNVRLEPSGVEWLGEVPEHWKISRIKTEMQNLNTRPVPLSGPTRGEMTSRQYDYCGASGVIDKVDGYVFDDEVLLIAEDDANLLLRNLPLTIIARGKFWVNNHAHILKPPVGSLEYFAALLECLDYTPWITGAAQPKLTQDRLMTVRIPVPPGAEQASIVAWIRNNTGHLRAAIDKGLRVIALLREFRTRLIADVVTGKLDVRKAAAKLPEEPPEVPVQEDESKIGGEAEASLEEGEPAPDRERTDDGA